MKRNFSTFEENQDSGRIIDQLISKITKGEFQVEGVDISKSTESPEAKVNLKIKGSLISAFWPETSDAPDEQESTSHDNPSLSPEEKKVQEQVASCYL